MSSRRSYNRRVYEVKDAQAVLFFLCPFGTKLWKVRPVIKKLQKAGYTVVGYDATDDTFYAADPSILITVIDQIADDIKSTAEEYQKHGIGDFGFFGSSLGAFIAYNCVARLPHYLRWGVFNTGGNIAEATWRLEKPRQIHEQKGITKQDLIKAWHDIQYPGFSGLRGNSYIFVSSPADKVAPIEDIDEYLQMVVDAGATGRILSLKARGHTTTVIRGFQKSVQLLEEVRRQAK